jgi:2-phosphosulfolactate phosphatase
MKSVRVVILPSLLEPVDLLERAVVVFDVLRATTTMTAALAHGAAAIRVFGSNDAARTAHAEFDGPKLLAGEVRTLPPLGFDLGNSPGDFTFERCSGKTLFMSTTNGTKALVAARSAGTLYTGAIVNAAAAGRAMSEQHLPVTLLCSGTDGYPAYDDLIGCGAVMANIADAEPANDSAFMAMAAWNSAKSDLVAALSRGASGLHLINNKLEKDFDFAAHLNKLPVVGQVREVDGVLTVSKL